MVELSTDLFFLAVLTILSPVIVAVIKPIAEKLGFMWAQINQRTVSAAIGGLLGGLYRVPYLYRVLNGEAPPATVKEFILGGILAGLAGSTIMGIKNDVTSGAIVVNSKEGLAEVRKRTEAGKRKIPSPDEVREA